MIELPKGMEPLQQTIDDSVKPVINISFNDEAPTDALQSRVGGSPYWPADAAYPENDGRPLYLLAQINFAEVPANDILPREGILQFFIGDTDLYGMDFGNQFGQNGFRVVWYPTPTQTDLTTDFSFLPESNYLPHSGAATLSFEMGTEPISIGDNVFEELLYDLEDTLEDDDVDIDDLFDAYQEAYDGAGHKLLGYPGFTQQDPRTGHEYVLLLQLDTGHSKTAHVQWGDMGIGNFFIRPADLANRDFSHVMYNWDCC